MLGVAPYTEAPALSLWERFVAWWRVPQSGIALGAGALRLDPKAIPLRACGTHHVGPCAHEDHADMISAHIESDYSRLMLRKHRQAVRGLK